MPSFLSGGFSVLGGAFGSFAASGFFSGAGCLLRVAFSSGIVFLLHRKNGYKNAPQVGTQKQRADLPAAIRSDGGAIVRIYCGRRLIQSGKQICADVTNGCAGSLHTVQHIGDMETVKLAKPFSNGSNGNLLAADTNAGLRRTKRIGQQLDDGFDGRFTVLGN